MIKVSQVSTKQTKKSSTSKMISRLINKLKKRLLEELLTKKINMSVLQHIFRPQRQLVHELNSALRKILHAEREDMEDVILYMEDLGLQAW
jgi:hypothetical protein